MKKYVVIFAVPAEFEWQVMFFETLDSAKQFVDKRRNGWDTYQIYVKEGATA